MKKRDQTLLNYTLFIILAIVCGYMINTYNHDFPVDLQRLEKLQADNNMKLNITLNFNLSSIKSSKTSIQNQLNKLFSKQFFLEFDLIEPTSNILTVDIVCESKSKTVEIVSGNKIQFFGGNTCENISEQQLKELRRVLLSFSLNLLEHSYEERYYDKDIFLNIYIYQTFKSNDTNASNQLAISNLKKTLTHQILQFSSALSISKDQIRINFKTIHPQEYINLSIENVINEGKTKFIKFGAVKKLHDQLQENYHNRINFRDYYNRQIVLFLNEQDAKISDNDENLGYYLNHEDDIFISSVISNTKNIQTIFNKALIELYDLSEILTMQDSLQHISLDLNLKAISSYFIKREFYSTYQAIDSQIKSVIKLRQTQYIIFKQTSIQITNQWMGETDKILQFGLEQADMLQKLVYKQEDLNKIEEIGYLDYFSNEYLMGVYLPIIVPVAYPYLIGIFGKIKELKNARKELKAKMD